MTVEHSKLRALAEAATPGPWRVYVDGPFDAIEIDSAVRSICSLVTWEHRPDERAADAAYIAAASPSTVLELLDENERLRVVEEACAIDKDMLRRNHARRCQEIGTLKARVKELEDWTCPRCGPREFDAERIALESEVARMRPVYEAAKAWRSYRERPLRDDEFTDAWHMRVRLLDAIDDALAKEPR
jgi:hypothetical protein